MGFWDKFKSDHIENIESSEDSMNEIIWKFPRNNKALKPGVKVTVRENQYVVMVHQMETGDAYGTGVHSLTYDNIPGLISTPTWNYSINSAFKADTFFINHQNLNDFDWKVAAPFNVIDPVAGLFEATCSGTLSLKITDPRMFFDHIVVKEKQVLSSLEVASRIESLISNDIILLIEGLKEPANYLVNDTEGLNEIIVSSLQDKYLRFGFRLTSMKMGLIELPPDVRTEMEEYAASQIKFINVVDEPIAEESSIVFDLTNYPVAEISEEMIAVNEPIVQIENPLEIISELSTNELPVESSLVEMDSASVENIAEVPVMESIEIQPIEMIRSEENFMESEDTVIMAADHLLPEASMISSVEPIEIESIVEPVVAMQEVVTNDRVELELNSPISEVVEMTEANSLIMSEVETSLISESSDSVEEEKVEFVSPDDHKYYVAIEGAAKGPFSLTDLLGMASGNLVNYGTLGWRKGLAEWMVLDSIPELKGLLPEAIHVEEEQISEEVSVVNQENYSSVDQY